MKHSSLLAPGVALFAVTAGCAPPEVDRPNVVLIVLDTLRADQLKAYGQEQDTAPYITGLAARSAVFENAFSSSSWTAPATASLLTGTYDDRHGVVEGFMVQLKRGVKDFELPSLNLTTPTLAQVLQRNGYSTFGLTANVNIGSEMKFDRGFDRFERQRPWPARGMLKRVREWKQEILSSAPYFLYLHLNDVHKPYEVREPWFKPLGGEDEDALARYRSELGYMDNFLARIHAELGWDSGVLLIVVSDHGEEFFEHGGWGHHFTLYDEVNRIVFLAHGPGIAPARIPEEVGIVDVAPTLLELLDISPPVPADGVSWAARLRGRSSEAPERVLFAHRYEAERELWAAIQGGLKLIEGPEGRELYDLRIDPGERNNLVGERPGELARLVEALARHRGRNTGSESNREAVPLDSELLEHLRELGYVND